MPKILKYPRTRFYASEREQALLKWMREFAWNSVITENVTNAILREMESLQRKKAYLKQEGQEAIKEYEELTISISLLEVFSVRWIEYMRELREN